MKYVCHYNEQANGLLILLAFDSDALTTAHSSSLHQWLRAMYVLLTVAIFLHSADIFSY